MTIQFLARSTGSCRKLFTTRRFFSLIALVICSSGASIAIAATPVTTVMLSGMPAPGTSAGVTFANSTSPSFPTLNGDAEVAFTAPLTGPGVTSKNTNGLWSGVPGSLSLRVRDGDAANSPIGAGTYKLTGSTNINAVGDVQFGTTVAGLAGIPSSGARAVAVAFPGATQVASMLFTPAPGTPSGGIFASYASDGGVQPSSKAFPPAINNAAQVAFQARVVNSLGTPFYSEWGIWAGAPDNVGLIAISGTALPGMPDRNTTRTFGPPDINNSGSVAFEALYALPGDINIKWGIWNGTAGNLSPVVRSGDAVPDAAPGVTFAYSQLQSVGAIVDYNDAGQVAFWAAASGSGVAKYGGYYAGTAGNLQAVLINGQQVDGLPAGLTVGVGNGESGIPGQVYMNNHGSFAVRTRVNGPQGKISDNGIFAGTPGDMRLINYPGEQAVGFPTGVTFVEPPQRNVPDYIPTITTPSLNDRGQLALFTQVSTGDFGIWATDLYGALELVIKTGDLLEVAPGDYRTIANLNFVGGGISVGGDSTGFNDNGQIAFWASFTDGSSGVFISNAVAVPEPGTFALIAIGLAGTVLAAHRRRSAGATKISA